MPVTPAAARGTGPSALVPLGVDEIIERHLHAYNEQRNEEAKALEGGDNARTRLQHKLPPIQLLPLPPSVAAQHRVQFSIRGRRYETTMDVAVTYCLTFYAFFHCPFDGSRTVGDVAVAHDGETEDVRVLSEPALLQHYIQMVEPLLLSFLRQQQQRTPQMEVKAVVGNAVSGGTPHSEGLVAPFPPALPRPKSVSYDAAGHLWMFEFPPRVTAEVEAQERRRRQQTAVDALTSAAGHITSDEISDSPFLLLQNDFMGMLLVYLRRCAKVRAEAASAARSPSNGKAAAYPVLPIRWTEMNYDEQVSFLQLLRAFGVVPLTSLYVQPSAPLSTSRHVGADAARVAAAAKAEGDACSLCLKAEAFARQQQQLDVTSGETRNINPPKRMDGCDDLVMAAKGCARCGMAGHAAEECPY
ncbi:hypothetical protein ABL78_5278 [Leptomonas seymouri]|uniref:CCHC-type domain-containing protein n=1 Tax=Leptomonas seymouri TaxID=5684 RepID=A0A0N0P570_LEPSE|nr:hypothetical protein ABL78_5278 [Leptomonas seymouri]|eukprot:KPI85657.1 hypothetical protein ABL78_5278 [Leptomonas seymouri]